MINTPHFCLICGSNWAGGHTLPGMEMEPGLRQFYNCGASMSVKILPEGAYQILFKNCSNDKPDNQQETK